ncbi:methyltransferase [uncultured Ruegeria sp.]|uniref:methyltransferase family protein n=1 Tax=uncultured Ruegeria sp. TaxID=259304 RepID=UPI0026115C4D|nr:methyltransferase [uncultured Ruegeria sp.]
MTKTVLILPGTALIYIPILIQRFSERWRFGVSVWTRLHCAVVAMLAVPALVLAANTMKLFAHDGHGTPAPWDPPQKFVVSGPYRFVRNPMLSSVILMILAEAVALNSPLLLSWALCFFLLNTVASYS